MQRSSLFRTALIASAMTVSLVASAQLPSKVGGTPVPSLAPMIKTVLPAVVTVSTKQRQRPIGLGSGVIVDAKNGYILTNAHVIDGATDVSVTLLDNRTLNAEIIGADKATDIAVLRVNSTKLVAISFADSSKAEVGDFVVAIGNPFGLEHSVTSGIVSGLGRAGVFNDGPDAFEDYIQTDAAINQGNSGGPLVNLSGELLGLNARIFSQGGGPFSEGGGNIGVGFAISSNLIKPIMEQLIKYKVVKRGRLGVRISNLPAELAQTYGLSAETAGVLVSEVQENSSAEKAGIKAGDVITAINSKAVRTARELVNSIGLMHVGDKAEVTLVRDGKPRKITAMVGESATAVATAVATDNSGAIHPAFEGSELVNGPDGVVVRSVVADSPAAQRFKPNDVIFKVGLVQVTTIAQLKSAIEKANVFALNVKRGNGISIIVVSGN